MNYTVLADNAQIEKPLTDERSYRFIKLEENDLHVLVINDPTTDKAAALLDVNVGSFADKKYEVSGLAHFCEHLLFMGTTKYPTENEYSSYLAKYLGNSNAYTAAENTNYFFQLNSDHLEGGLDRFAQFFIDPLFSKLGKDREINAVDSENKKNLQQDVWRLYQLDKTTSNGNHPYNGFSTGNYQTLHVDPLAEHKNVRDVLIDFYSNSYSANIMNLVILGKEDLDTLSNWAGLMFSAIPNHKLPRPDYNKELIYAENDLLKIVKAKPIMDNHKLELNFLIPSDLDESWKSKPASYFSHLLGHESEGSVLDLVKNKGWVNVLSSGSMRVCKGSSLFVLEFDLTLKGLENWQEIVHIVFQYLKLVLEDEPKEWIWKEVSNISKVNFKFQQKSDSASTVSKLSSSLHKVLQGSVPPEYLLSKSINREFNPTEIKQIGKFLNPDNFRIALISQTNDGLDKKEKWYGTEYSYELIPSTLLDQIKKVKLNPELAYPIPNDFIPENFEVYGKKSETPLLHPYLLEDTNRVQIWYKQDDRFEVPKGSIDLIFHLPDTNAGLESSTYSNLYVEMIEDDLNQITYYASLVGLRVHIASARDGFHVKISGYNDKLPKLLEQVLLKFKTFKPRQDRFDALKAKMIQDFKNFGYNVPYNQVGTHFQILVNDKTYQYADKVKVLEKASFADFYQFISGIWTGALFSEVLIHGNFNVLDAFDIKKSFTKFSQEYKPIADNFEGVDKVIRFANYVQPPGSATRYELPLQDEKNINSCIDYNINLSADQSDSKLRVLTDLFATIIREPCFDQLRTKEQLGYVVFSLTKLGRTSLGFRFIIQSERSTDYLEYRIEEFVTKFGKYLNTELTDDDFVKFKKALKAQKLTKLKSLSEESSRFRGAIGDGYFDFEARQRHVLILEDVTKEELRAFFKDYILNEAGKSLTTVVHLKSQAIPEVPRLKLIQSATINYLFREDIEFVSDKLEEIIDKHQDDIKALADAIAEDTKSKSGDLYRAIQEGIEKPVPAKFPTGKLYTSVEKYRKDFSLGGTPSPFKPYSEYYYPDDLFHL